MRAFIVDVPLKTTIEVARQRKTCIIVQEILRRMKEKLVPGTTTSELNRFCRSMVDAFDVHGVLKGYRGFPGTICISVNHVAAHGVPGEYRLARNDIVTLDLSLEYDGWCGDAAWTYAVGKPSAQNARLISAAWKSTMSGIQAAVAGNTFGDVGYAVKQTAEAHGYKILERFVGHGIGRELHEEPIVMNSGVPGSGLQIVPGMVFTVEPILTAGSTSVTILEDDWTVVTKDGSPCAQFEHTVAVLSDETKILTLTGVDPAQYLDFPPYF